jgi:peroxiredoxin
MRDLTKLPADLPVPIDDGACRHLPGRTVPSIALHSTLEREVDLAQATAGQAVLFFYPRTGRPDDPPPDGWDALPGMRGCTPQSCGFRDLRAEFARLSVAIYGISTQDPAYQVEFAARMHIPYEILSDCDLRLTRAMNLPTIEFRVRSGGPTTLIKRMAWYVERSRIERVWYPVFPPDRNAAEVLEFVTERQRQDAESAKEDAKKGPG